MVSMFWDCYYLFFCLCRSRSSCNADPARVKVFAIQSDYAVGKAIEAAEAKAAEAGTDRGYAKVRRNLCASAPCRISCNESGAGPCQGTASFSLAQSDHAADRPLF